MAVSFLIERKIPRPIISSRGFSDLCTTIVSKTAILLNIAIKGCNWPLVIVPLHCHYKFVHVLIQPYTNTTMFSPITNTLRPCTFSDSKHASIQYLSASTASAAWARSASFSKTYVLLSRISCGTSIIQ